MRVRYGKILLAAVLVLGLNGCGSRTEASKPDAAPVSPAVVGNAASGNAQTGHAPESPVPAATGAAAGQAGGGADAIEPGEAASGDLGAASVPASAPEERKTRRVGEIVYTEGAVTLHRGGQDPQSADVGQVVENFDVVQTGARSRATLELDPGAPGGAEIRLAENTVFYYETAIQDSGARKTVLQLLAGSVALKVEKLADGDFHVATDGAVLGVRGTTFIVNTIPDGALLVTCAEGRVEVSDDSGDRLYAQPGRAVSQTSGQPIREELVALESLADYRLTWVDESMKSLESRAPKVIAGYAKRYTEGRAAFDSAYGKLRQHAAVLDMWDTARQTGGEPRFTDWIAEKKAVAPALFECLSALFKLERPFYRLQELAALHDRGIGAGTLPDGRTTMVFFNAFQADAREVSERLSWVRRALLLFKYASAGSPLGQFFGAKAESLGGGALFVEE